MDVELPKIRQEFIETMVNKYGDNIDHAESIADRFLKIFEDAVNYSFSKNHAIPYSYIGYISAWLRHYYPLEFLTSAFIIFSKKTGDDVKDKIKKLTEYGKEKGIEIKNFKFRFSKGDYFFNKETNTIYEGVGSVKGNNVRTGDALYELKEKDFESFTDFLLCVKDSFNIYRKEDDQVDEALVSWKTIKNFSQDEIKDIDKTLKKVDENEVTKFLDFEHKIDKSKLLSLVRLKYFDCFGGNKKLELVLEKFFKEYKPDNKTLLNKWKKYHLIREYEDSLEDEEQSLFYQLSYELDYLGRCVSFDENIKQKILFVTKVINVANTRATFEGHLVKSGEAVSFKVPIKKWRQVSLQEGDLVQVFDYSSKPKQRKINGVWQKHPTEKEYWLENYQIIRKNEKVK